MEHHESATAHKAWERKWRTQDGRADWLRPEADVLKTMALLRERGTQRVLDLGCGVGRHALALAGAGFEVWAVDMSDSGLAYAQEQARAQGLFIRFNRDKMTALPFEDAGFDYVLAWNVIYHGVQEVVQKSIAEIQRVLKPGGLFQCTMLSKRHHRFGKGRELAPDVWLQEGSADPEHGHPHLFCNAAGLVNLFKGFELVSLADKEQQKPKTYHWVALAERL